ncbi:MAG: SDR family NAD(P)-dependent oxidoreductase [Chloroflexota bacterium]
METLGKTVLITGGGSGIGLYLAEEFLKAGSKVIVCGRSMARLEQAKQKHPDLILAQCDVTDEAQIKALRERCDSEFGGVDILVNNAGVYLESHAMDSNSQLAPQLKELDINFGGPLRMVHHFLPDLLTKPSAAIVNVTSSLAFIPFVAAPSYSATKAGMHSWTLSLRKQLAESNVKVFELMPPLVDTEMVAGVDGIPKMQPDQLASTFMRGFKRNNYEIAPGIGGALRALRRLAPRITFAMLNR